MNIAARLQSAYADAFEEPCLISPEGASLTYGELDRLSAQFAQTLRERGVEAGDRVVVQVDKSFGNVALYLGVLRVGAVYVPLNTGYTAAEVSYFLDDANPRIFVCSERDQESMRTMAAASGVACVEWMSTNSEEGFWAAAASSHPAPEIIARKADDLAAIVYTSGTTGRSKGAMLTHRALIDNAERLHGLWEFNPQDVLLHALPIFHVHGLFVALHTSLLNATPILFLKTFDAALVREQLSNATIFMGVPTFYSRLAQLPGFGEADCRNIRVFISGSAPLTKKASDDWEALTGHRILERYGMSEAGMITSNPLNGERIAGTVGFPVPGYEVRVADEHGREVPRGEVGGIEIRGPSLFKGYWHMPEKTAQEFRPDGYFITGDSGTMDDTGRVTIVGRSKDLIISGGYNVYPKEIEQVLDALPGVLESAVVGVPHPEMGEGVVAVLVARDDTVSESVIMEALSRSLARFKHPRRFYWVSELPRNTMGKVQKAELRRTFATAYSN